MRDNPVVVTVFLVSGMFVSAAPVQVFGSDTVGIDLMDWLSFNLYKMLVLPEASSPSINMRISFLPKIFESVFPMLT